MSSYLFKTSQLTDDKVTNNFGIKQLKLRNRNYSNPRFIQPLPLCINPQTDTEKIQPQPTNRPLMKKYSINRLKNTYGIDKIPKLRNNGSLKIFKSQTTAKLHQQSKLQKSNNMQSCEIMPILQDMKKDISQSKSISIKRRVELLKKNQNILRIGDRKPFAQKIKTSSNTELGSTIQMGLNDHKIQNEHKIKSQNYLGQGLKKSSSSKIKILVKNPFQKIMKLQQQFKQQSQIFSKLQESCTSISNRFELQQMLSLF